MSSIPARDAGILRAWEAYQSTAHFGSLDGLRCLSILAVLWHHGPGISLPGLAGRGFLGVPLFFAISGFLITTLLIREHQKNGAISLRRFYIRRSLRIFPLYFAVLGVYCSAVYLVERDSEAARRFYANLPYFLTYTSNWFVGSTGTFSFAWSLAAEEQFYSTWPPALRLLRPGRAVWLVVAILGAAVVWNTMAPGSVSTGNFGLLVLANVPMAICWGCLVAVALHSRQGFALLWKVVGYRWMPAVLLCLIVTILGTLQRVEIPIHFLFAALVASCVIRENSILSAAMRQRFVVHLGVISYGMYLMHGLAYAALDKIARQFALSWQPHSVSGFFLALVVTVGAATFSFRYFETPFLRIKSRFAA